jgi:hypothetical protein
MNVKICENCSNFQELPKRYKCIKYQVIVKHYRASFVSRYPEEFSKKETFLRRAVPDNCSNHLATRTEDICLNCKFCKKEQLRVKCKTIHNSWHYINDYMKQSFEQRFLYQICPYEFEQEMAELNEC